MPVGLLSFSRVVADSRMIPDRRPRFTFDIIIRLSSGIRDAGLKATRARARARVWTGRLAVVPRSLRRRHVRGRFKSSESAKEADGLSLGKRNPREG